MVNDEKVSIVYAGNGTTRVFDYPYTFTEPDEITGYLSDGTTVTKITSNFEFNTTTKQYTYPTTGASIATGYNLLLTRHTEKSNKVDLPHESPFDDIERQFDKIVRILQEIDSNEGTGVGVTVIGNGFNGMIPKGRPYAYIRFNKDASAFEVVDDPFIEAESTLETIRVLRSDMQTLQSDMETARDAVEAAKESVNNTVGSFESEANTLLANHKNELTSLSADLANNVTDSGNTALAQLQAYYNDKAQRIEAAAGYASQAKESADAAATSAAQAAADKATVQAVRDDVLINKQSVEATVQNFETLADEVQANKNTVENLAAIVANDKYDVGQMKDAANTSVINAANSATAAANSATQAHDYAETARQIVEGNFATVEEMEEYVKNVTVKSSNLVVTKGNSTEVSLTIPYATTSNVINSLKNLDIRGKTVKQFKDAVINLVETITNYQLATLTVNITGNLDPVFSMIADDTYVIDANNATPSLMTISNNVGGVGISRCKLTFCVWNKEYKAYVFNSKFYYEGYVQTSHNNLSYSDTIGLQSGRLIFDANGTSVDKISVGDNPINYNGNGYKYLFMNGKGDYADIYADEYYGTFRGKAMVGGITSAVDLSTPYTDTYSKKLEFTDSGTANNLSYKCNFIMTLKSNMDIAQLAIPVSSNARISLRCLPNQANNTLVGDWLEIPYLRDIKPIAAAEVAKIVNSAPSTLDTLNELANALGNDPNFATTVMNQIGTKANADNVYTKAEIDTALGTKTNTADLVNILYPVGIIVEFAADVDPNTVWQGTTWERMPAGRVLISAGQYSESDYSHNYTLGETGGEATHQLTVDEMPSHQHGGSTSTDGAHEHGFWQGKYGGDKYGIATNAQGNAEHNVWHTVTGNGNHTHTFATDWRGGNASHNIVQPYIVVNRWKRTA